MNAVEKAEKTTTTTTMGTDNSSVPVKMPSSSKRKSKNRKQQNHSSHHQQQQQQSSQSQGSLNAIEKKIVPEKFPSTADESVAPSINGDTLDLISQKLNNDNMHIKENGCTDNHYIENNDHHNEWTENTPNSSKNLLHANKVHHNMVAAVAATAAVASETKQSNNKLIHEKVESQGKNKSIIMENGNSTRPSSSKLSKKSKTKQQSTTVTTTTSTSTSKVSLVDGATEIENTITPSVKIINGNNNNVKSHEEQICNLNVTKMTVNNSSEPDMHGNPSKVVDDFKEGVKSSLSNKECRENELKGNDPASNNSKFCQNSEGLDDENDSRTTQNGALRPSISRSFERLSSNNNNINNNNENTIDKVNNLPKEERPSEPSAQSSSSLSSALNGLDLSNIVIDYKEYESEHQMKDIMRLIQTELSEPYSIYTYRYFIYNWPKLCFLAAHGNEYVGAIVCKLDMHMNVKRGYIAMLAVKKEYRKLKIGTTLVQKAIEAMLSDDADEVVLETEMKNIPALRLYENLGFVRDKRLFRYYLNGVDALRLKLWFR